MKAKEMAALINDSDDPAGTLVEVVRGILNDVSRLMCTRGVKQIDGCEAIVRELNYKWLAVVKRVRPLLDDEIGRDAFLALFKAVYPKPWARFRNNLGLSEAAIKSIEGRDYSA